MYNTLLMRLSFQVRSSKAGFWARLTATEQVGDRRSNVRGTAPTVNVCGLVFERGDNLKRFEVARFHAARDTR
jgi:hypothetical protein